MAELADAIVQSGRATLEWSIREINENSKWRAEVLYGGEIDNFIIVLINILLTYGYASPCF